MQIWTQQMGTGMKSVVFCISVLNQREWICIWWTQTRLLLNCISLYRHVPPCSWRNNSKVVVIVKLAYKIMKCDTFMYTLFSNLCIIIVCLPPFLLSHALLALFIFVLGDMSTYMESKGKILYFKRGCSYNSNACMEIYMVNFEKNWGLRF